jgi:molybdopterin-guanine dinucleotide biosynthesis protein A
VREPSESVTAAIVAGGASSRFSGTPKGLESVGGQRILDRIAAAATAVTREIVLISNSDDAGQWLDGARVVRDVRPERGSIVGIHTALITGGRRVLVLAWDMPFLTAPLLDLIVRRAVDAPFAVIPEGTSGLEPFCALYTRACLPAVERAIDEGDLRATALPLRFPSFTRLSSTEVATIGDPARLFFNVNSAADLARAEAIAQAQRSRQR